jgi:hypothetical protein
MTIIASGKYVKPLGWIWAVAVLLGWIVALVGN